MGSLSRGALLFNIGDGDVVVALFSVYPFLLVCQLGMKCCQRLKYYIFTEEHCLCRIVKVVSPGYKLFIVVLQSFLDIYNIHSNFANNIICSCTLNKTLQRSHIHISIHPEAFMLVASCNASL